MRVLFVYPAHENLGIEYLSAVLRAAGHVTELAFDPVLFDDAFIQHSVLGRVFDHGDVLVEQESHPSSSAICPAIQSRRPACPSLAEYCSDAPAAAPVSSSA